MTGEAKKKSSSKQAADAAGKTPTNGYVLFLKEKCEELRQNGKEEGHVAKEARSAWKSMSDPEKQVYKDRVTNGKF